MQPILQPCIFGLQLIGMKKTGTLRIWLRTDKPNKGGTMPIFIIYSLHGKRQFLNTGVSIYPEQWDNETIRALSPSYGKKYGLKVIDLPTLQDAKKDIQSIAKLKVLISKVETEYTLKDTPFTSLDVMQAVKNKLNPPTEKPDTQNNVLDFLTDWINKKKVVKKKGSMQVYRTVTQRLADYELYTKQKITFESIDHSFFEYFKIFLETNYNLNSITIAKQLSTLKTFLSKAEKDNIKIPTNYKKYTIERQTDLEVIALTPTEFDLIRDADLTQNQRFDAIRDVFIFSCCTGMRFSDLEQLTRAQIKQAGDNIYIQQTVTKTDKKIKIPLNSTAKGILNKYSEHPRPLPIISNQKSNEALHNLCEYLGINEPIEIVRTVCGEKVKTEYPKHELLTMHSGRKSFATLSLQKGMKVQHVMKIGGWDDFKSFQRYVNVTDDDAQDAMNKIWG